MSAAITLDRTKAPAGTSVHVGVTGTGFADNGTVTVTIGGVAAVFDSGGVVSATGTFADTFNIAVTGVAVGALTVSVTDGTNTVWNNLGGSITGNGATNTVFDPVGQPHNFYQVLSIQ